MAEKTNEIDALKQVDKLFNDLEDEERSRTIDFIAAKYKINGSKQNSNYIGISGTSIQTNLDTSGLTLKEFIRAKKPEGFYETIACLAYYLEKVQGMEGFKTSDVTKANKDARLNPMSNPTVFVNDSTSKYGYLTPIGTGKKALSAKGESIVEALPDREKVKQVLEGLPNKRKAAKRSKKTNK